MEIVCSKAVVSLSWFTICCNSALTMRSSEPSSALEGATPSSTSMAYRGVTSFSRA